MPLKRCSVITKVVDVRRRVFALSHQMVHVCVWSVLVALRAVTLANDRHLMDKPRAIGTVQANLLTHITTFIKPNIVEETLLLYLIKHC